MKTFEERYTAWLDGVLPEAEKAAFECEHPNLFGEREQVIALRSLLREQLRAPQLSHPGFFKSELLKKIERDQVAASKSKPRRSWLGLPRLTWVGLGSALAAAAMVLAFIPHKKAGPGDYLAEIKKLQTSEPGVTVTVDSKKDVTIIKIDGLEKVPPEKELQAGGEGNGGPREGRNQKVPPQKEQK
jgi:hypothetical protein